MQLRVRHRSSGTGFPGDSDGKESACNAEYLGSIPGQEDLLEKEMATHSSVLSKKISWTEETGGLYSPWDYRVGHDRVTEYTHKIQY